MGWPTLRTDRLLLRPLVAEDLDALAALHEQESFWWYPSGRGWSREETRNFFEGTVERYQDPGMAVSAVVVRESDELAGWAGLSVPTFLPEILPAVEVGWRLGEHHRRRGYATEAGAAWVQYGFDEMGLDRIVSICEPENGASAGVMRRLGFTLERETTHPALGVPLHVASLAREDWKPA
ncbi:GNAT family N-acetyltransferase [soil metagenome]